MRPHQSALRLTRSVLLIAGSFLVTIPTFAQGPKAVVAEPIKDAGTVYRGDKIIHEFTIKNEGNVALMISNVNPSCGCTTADYDKTIAPGKTGKVKVIVDPSSFLGPISKIVTVSSNDSMNSPLQLTIKANVMAYVISKPGFARFTIVQGEGGTNESKQIISATDGATFKITGSQSELPNVKVTYHEATATEKLPDITGSQWVVQILLPDNAAVGPLSSYVHLKTNHPKQEEVDISITGVVRPMIGVSPPNADIGSITATEFSKKTFDVHNYATAPVNVTNVECTVKGIKASYESLNPGRLFQVRITVDPAMAKGPFNGKVIIHTDNTKTPVIEVPVKGTIL